MKRLVTVLLAMALCAACALAEDYAGPAAAQVVADLLDAPHDGAHVLMRYYIGTRVEVVREADADYVQVNVGQEGGSLMGYMEKRDLVFGEKEIRKVRAERVHYRGAEEQTCRLYSYPDKLAPVLDEQFGITVKDVWGYLDDEWLHVQEYRGTTGFVARDELEGEAAYIDYAPYIYVEPAQDEMTREEAIDYAREMILFSDNSSVYAGSADAQITEEMLALCTVECDLLYDYDTPDVIMYSVLFRHPDTGHIYAGVDFLAQGKEIVKIGHGNG